MTDIFNAFRMLVVLFFVGIVVWGLAQIVPQVQTAATLAAHIEAENALAAANAEAAPTRVALEVEATAQAIRNERLRAEASSQAILIQAEAMAERERATATTWHIGVLGMLLLSALGLILVGVVMVVRFRMAQGIHRAALHAAQREGGVLELPNGHRVLFPEQRAVPQLGAGRSDEEVQRAAAPETARAQAAFTLDR